MFPWSGITCLKVKEVQVPNAVDEVVSDTTNDLRWSMLIIIPYLKYICLDPKVRIVLISTILWKPQLTET